MPTLTVLGHINPDTDSTCSALATAFILTESGQEAEAAVAGPLNKETVFVLNHFGLTAPNVLGKLSEDHNLVIVDTNNPEELLTGWDQAKLVEIIDHHKLAGITTPDPIRVTIRPVACTCTLLYYRAQEEGVQLSKEIAGCMLASILSDTLKFTSPTTTEEDKLVAGELATLCGEDVDALADGMFAAKSDLSGMSVQDILTVDSKVYTIGGRKMRLSVLETTKPDNALAMKDELLTTMESMKAAEELDGALFFVVDIINNGSTLILPTAEEAALAEKAFGLSTEDHLMLLPGIVSRKKQMIPKLEAAA